MCCPEVVFGEKRAKGRTLGNTNICRASGKEESQEKTSHVGRELGDGGVLAAKGGADFKKGGMLPNSSSTKSLHSSQAVWLFSKCV